MRNIIFEQIETARHSTPGLDGIIHGTRKIKQGKHGSRASLIYSAKNQALIPVESWLERDFCYELERNPKVLLYRTQAISVPYRDSTLHPDFLIFDRGEDFYIREIKHSALTNASRTVRKTNYLMTLFGKLELEYGVVTEQDMWKPIEKSNWAMLYNRGGRLGIAQDLLDWVVPLAQNLPHQTRTLSALRLAIQQSKLPAYLLEASLFNGTLQCRMDRPINQNTIIEVAQ
ncbi:hypothetical protein ACIQW9_01155 [Herminiimonas sp. NPDC097707]|uniref:hypothetical protein n=1 Tax=Herminiimonas sp. NPDC097707 TaxID=3364007 RepID=UPI00383B2E1A